MSQVPPAIEASHVYKVFAPELSGGEPTVALRDVSLSVRSGSVTVIGGANGSGKSVLMSIAAGLMEPSEGTCGTSSRPGLVFQDAATQILGDTPMEDVAVGPRNQKVPKKDIPGLCLRALRAVHLDGKADFPSHLLSGGEKRRLAVASILAMRRSIIIFDEPYANLDYPGVCDVNLLIREMHGGGKTVVILTHEIEKCLALADHFVVLHRGSVMFDGPPEDSLACPLEDWGIRNPVARYDSVDDMVWLPREACHGA